jgi:raffinose/stachyose/melibiose transport system permease protein
VVACAWLFVAIVPFVFMALTGFKTDEEVISSAAYDLPKSWSLTNFRTVLGSSFPRGLLNSLIVCSVSIALIVIISAMASWAFARMHFRFSGPLMSMVVAGLIVPVHSTLIPIYILIRGAGLYDTLAALVLPYVAFALPISIVILTGFMREIPRELDEAATIDGAGPFRVFFSVGLPLSRGGIVTVSIFNAVTLWNEFVFAFVLTSSPQNRTLPLTIWDFQGQYSSSLAAIMAALLMSALPLILTYIVFQDRLVKGMMAGAVKA